MRVYVNELRGSLTRELSFLDKQEAVLPFFMQWFFVLFSPFFSFGSGIITFSASMATCPENVTRSAIKITKTIFHFKISPPLVY